MVIHVRLCDGSAFGAWGHRAINTFSRLASRLAAQTRLSKATVLFHLYGKLSCSLVHSNARVSLALLSAQMILVIDLFIVWSCVFVVFVCTF